MRLTRAVSVLVILGAVHAVGWPQMVIWDVIAAGGEVNSTSGGYGLAATVGQAAAGMQGGPTYRIWEGFWNPGLAGPVGGDRELGPVLPTIFSLSQNHPNPFQGRTEMLCGLPRECHVTVGVYDLNGRVIRVLTDGGAQAGYHPIVWDGHDLGGREAGSGVYICRMTALGASGTLCELQRPVLLIR